MLRTSIAAIAFCALAGYTLHLSHRVDVAAARGAELATVTTTPPPPAAELHPRAPAAVTRECVELLWLQVNQILRQWPAPSAIIHPPTICDLAPFEESGAAREWKGQTMAPPPALKRAIQRGREAAR